MSSREALRRNIVENEPMRISARYAVSKSPERVNDLRKCRMKVF